METQGVLNMDTKTDITVGQLNAQAELISALRSEESMKGQEKKAVSEKLEAAENAMLFMLEQCNLTTYKSPFGTVTRKYRKSVKIPRTEEDRAAFFQYLKDKGLFDSYIGVDSRKLTSLYNEEFEAAVASGNSDWEMPGIHEVTITPILSLTRA